MHSQSSNSAETLNSECSVISSRSRKMRPSDNFTVSLFTVMNPEW